MAVPSITDPVQPPKAGMTVRSLVQLLLAGAVLLTSMLGFAPAFPVLEHLRLQLMLAALGTLALAVRPRQVTAVKLSLAAFVLNIVTIAPFLPFDSSAPVKQVDVTLLHLNTSVDRADSGAIALEAERQQADIVVLLGKLTGNELLPAVLRDRYPWRLDCAWLGCNIIILSRFPARRMEFPAEPPRIEGRTRRLMVARVDTPAGAMTLAATHFVRPFEDRAQAMEAEYLSGLIRALPAPLVLVGDFNLSPWSQRFQQFAAGSSLRRADATWGTWPTILGPLGIPVDHVLLSADTRATVSRTGDLGSHHLGLITRISLPAPLH
jgi:endonuclease/exonuclease/phosphatase (EEP) superfamily protein YafD